MSIVSERYVLRASGVGLDFALHIVAMHAWVRHTREFSLTCFWVSLTDHIQHNAQLHFLQPRVQHALDCRAVRYDPAHDLREHLERLVADGTQAEADGLNTDLHVISCILPTSEPTPVHLAPKNSS